MNVVTASLVPTEELASHTHKTKEEKKETKKQTNKQTHRSIVTE